MGKVTGTSSYNAIKAAFLNQFMLNKPVITSFSVLVVVVTLLLVWLSTSVSFTSAVYATSFGLLAWAMIGIVSANVCADIATRDFEKPSGLIVLSQPVERWRILIARLSAAVLFTMVPLTVLYASGVIAGFALYGSLMPNVFASYGFSVLYMASFMALIAMISTLADSRAVPLSAGITLAVVAIFVFVALEYFFGVQPWFFLPYGGMVISSIMSVPYPSSFTLTNGFTLSTPAIWEAAAIKIGYLAISLTAAVFFYSRKDVL